MNQLTNKLYKAPGQKTQRSVSEFASQTAYQFYDILVTNHALRSISTNENSMLAWKKSNHIATLIDGDEVSVELKGKYNLRISDDVIQLMKEGGNIEVDWHSDKKKMKMNNSLHFIDKELVQVILEEMRRQLKDILGQLHPPKMETKLFFTCTHIFKDGSGMTERMFILKKQLSLENLWKCIILQKYSVLLK